ncbi:DNA-3-methyladenine glycosylase family protein [Subtercola vilae]|nr:DNA-3-methyladenine glycosylase 2 family protein [Subtercola vilae]
MSDTAAWSRVDLTLPARQPFDGAGVMRFLAVHAVKGVETYSAGTYRRTLRLPQGRAVVAVRLAAPSPSAEPAGPVSPAGIECTLWLEHGADVAEAEVRLAGLFDVQADAQAIDGVLGRVAELRGSLAAAPGIRVPGSVDAHETLFRTLIGQQVSVTAARTVQGRLAAALGDELTLGGTPSVGDEPSVDAGQLAPGVWRFFPTAEQFAAGGAAELRGPPRRVQTILEVAEALAEGRLVIDASSTDATLTQTELTERLVAMPGIGPWTAGYVAMRVLGAPDALLDGDLALRAGAAELGLPGERRELVRFAERVAPWRSYFGMHLWREAVARLAAGT